MVEAVLSPLLTAIIEKLASQIGDEVQLLRGVRKEVEKLSGSLAIIQAFINDAEEKVTMRAVRLWLEQLEDAAYDADDIIDEFATELLRYKVTGAENSNQENQVCCFSSPCLSLKQVMLGYKIGNSVKEISEKIDRLVKVGTRLGLREGISEKIIRAGDRMETNSAVITSEIYGRDKEKIDIVDMLINGGIGLETEDLSVIPIVGLGGLGKTTLAKLAYNDQLVAKHFEIKIWVCVSDDFDVKSIIIAVIESITKKKPTISRMDNLQCHLQEELKHRRFLLVMDDVWNEDIEKWDSLRRTLLRCGGKGSKIIVTTRSRKVAEIMGTINPYLLGVLSHVDCWSLFKQRAFGRETEHAYPNLVPIGERIVQKCKGVPLAAKALGSLMFFKRDENDWLFVRDCEIWNLPEDQNGILSALRLSYNHLPAHLKQCFAYCSIFPKDYRINKKDLIQQWIANGFIQSSTATGSRPAEDIGNEYFNNLLWMSFFQDEEKNEWGDILRCKMHDLVHDLAQSVATETCLVLEVDEKKSISKQVRHLSLYCRDEHVAPMGSIYEAKKLRTLLFYYKPCLSYDHNVLYKMLSTFRYLRVLIITDDGRERLPASIGNLIHLRYLGIYCSGINKLPKSISKLKNLQTLKLDAYVAKLPRDMSVLINLRHLDIRNYGLLTCTPSKIGDLIFLQTLPVFFVTKDRRGGIGELHKLDLRGILNLKSLENVDNVDEVREANLKDKHNLRELGFYWSRNAPTENREQVLEGLQPHPNLKTLRIENYNGVWFSRWLMDLMLPNLVCVRLNNCKSCELLPPFGSLPFLEILELREMHSVKYLGDELDNSCTVKAFPSLKILRLDYMPNLEGLPHTNGKDSLPCLEQLIICQCPKLTSLPRLLSLKKLELHKSNAKILTSIASLTSLSFLSISGIEELEFLPEGMFQHLKLLQTLYIRNCPLPEELRFLTSLKFLRIGNCASLTSLPNRAFEGLTSLEFLEIEHCHKLTCLPPTLGHLTLLKGLKIYNAPALSALPEDLQHLTNLEELKLGGFDDRFTSLPEWLGCLTSLQSPRISKLSNVTSLPRGLQHLSSLRFLRIENCPHLEKRCRKDTGEDWHKIQHIPGVFIGDNFF